MSRAQSIGLCLKVNAAVCGRFINSPATRGGARRRAPSGGLSQRAHAGRRAVETYNFWKDAFDTYQSLSTPMQFAWLVLPPTFLLTLVALVLRFWLRCRQLGPAGRGDLVYTFYRNDFGNYDVYRHGDVEGDVFRVEGGTQRDELN